MLSGKTNFAIDSFVFGCVVLHFRERVRYISIRSHLPPGPLERAVGQDGRAYQPRVPETPEGPV